MELDLQSLFGLHVHSCTHWLRLRNLPPAPHLPRLGSYTRALLVSQDSRHLFVTLHTINKQPCLRFYNQHQQLLAQQQQQLSGKQPPPAASSGKKGAAKRGKDSHLSQVSSFVEELSKELNLSCS
jgi:hypothetical protein